MRRRRSEEGERKTIISKTKNVIYFIIINDLYVISEFNVIINY